MAKNIEFDQKLPGLHKKIGLATPLSPKFMPMEAIESFTTILDSHPDWKLKIIGFGELFKDIQTIIKTHGLQDKVQVFGPLAESEMYDVLKRVDIMLIPSDCEDDTLFKNIIRLGTPVIVHENHSLKDFMKLDPGLIAYDGSIEQMAINLKNTIDNIDEFNATELRNKRLEYRLANIK